MKHCMLGVVLLGTLFMTGCEVVTGPVDTSSNDVETVIANLDFELAKISGQWVVTDNLTLPTSAKNGVTVSWASDLPSVLSAKGIVNRPLEGLADQVVTLTAVASKGAESRSRAFPMLVKARPAATTYTVMFNSQGGNSVTDLTGIVSGKTISAPVAPTKSGFSFGGWYSDSGLITAWDFGANTVTSNVTLYAKWTVVDSSISDVAAAKVALVVGYASGDSASSVTQDLVLSLTGANGVTISWASSGSAVTALGRVTRPASGAADTAITLTATLTKGSVTDKKTFVVTVKAFGTGTGDLTLTGVYTTVVIAFSGEASILAKGSSMAVTATPSIAVDSYQWYLDGVATDGASSATFTIIGNELSVGPHQLMVVVSHAGNRFSTNYLFAVQ